MSRRRNRSGHQGADGTELMLDTVANLFGGIVLIALLIAIMSGQQAHQSDAKTEATAREVINAAGENVRIAAELTAAETSLRDLRTLSKLAESSRDPAIEEVAMHLTEALVLERALLENDREKLRRIRSMRGDLERLEREVDRESASLQVELRELKARRDRALADRAPAAELPIRGRTDQPPLHLVLRWGRLYLLQGPEGEPVAGVNRKEVQRHVLHLSLDPAAGLQVRDDWETKGVWRNILGGFPSSKYYAQIGVYDDSYPEFLSVRRQLLLSGYRYRIERFMGDDPIVLVPGDTGVID